MVSQSQRSNLLAPIFRVQRGGIAIALLIRVVLFSTAVTLILTVMQLALIYHSEMSRLQSEFDEINVVNSRSLGRSLWALDVNQLPDQLDGILRMPSIRAVEVREIGASGHPFTVSRGERQTARSIAKEIPLLCCGENQHKIGVLRIEATLTNIYQNLLSQALIILLSNAVKTFLVAIFILFMMHRLAIRHVLDITAAINNTTLADDAVPLRLRRARREDELEQMVDSINSMRNRLHAREQEFRAMVENSPDKIARYDTQCRRIYVNHTKRGLFGLPVEKVLGKTPVEISTLPEAQIYMQRIQGVLISGHEEQMDFPFSDNQGRVGWGHMRLVPEFEQNGVVASVLVITQDISERKLAEAALLESQQRYRDVFENVSDALYLLEVTEDGRFRNIEVNPALERSTGIAREAMIGKYVGEAVPEDVGRAVVAKYRRCVEAGIQIDEEIELDLPTGRRSYHSTLIPVFDANGHIHRIAGITRDTTARKQAEMLVRERLELELRLSRMLDQIPGFIYTYQIDRNGHERFPYVSAGIQDICGLQPCDVVDAMPRWNTILHPDDRPAIDAAIKNSVRNMTLFCQEFRVFHPQKDERWIEAKSMPVLQPDGSILSYGVMLDITNRKLMEQAIARSEMALRSVMDSSPDTIIQYDNEGRIRYLNAKLLDILGVPTAEVVGKLPHEAWPDGKFAHIEQAVFRVLATGSEVTVEHQRSIPEGGIHFQHIRVVPERGAFGEVIGVLAFGRDITDLKRYEQVLLERAETEQRQSQFFRVSPGYFYTVLRRLDGSYTITFASRGARDLIGVEPEFLEQNTSAFVDMIHPDDVEVMFHKREKSARDLTPHHAEYRIIHPQKGLRWIETRSLPQRVSDGGTCWNGFMHDVTDRKRIEEERLFHLQFLASLDQVNRAIQGAHDFKQMMSDSLDAVLSIFGCDRAFLIYPCDPEADAWHVQKERTRPECRGAFAAGSVTQMDEDVATWLRVILDADGPVKCGPGTEYPLAPGVSERFGFKTIMSTALYPKMGKPWQFGIHQCSNDRIWAENEERLLQEIGRRLEDGLTSWLINQDLQVSEQKFRSLAENSPDLIVRYDAEFRRTYVNPSYVRELEIPLDLALHVAPSATWRGDMAFEEYLASLQKVIETGKVDNFVLSWARKTDGRVNYYDVVAVPEWSSHDQANGVMVIGRNISALMATERQLEQSRAELRGLIAKNETVREEERKRIARDVHDELGQILTGLQMDVSILSTKFGQKLPALREHLSGTLELVNKSLTTARNVASALRPASLDLGIVFAIDWLVGRFAKNTGIRCEMHVGDEDWDIDLDESTSIALYRIAQESLTNVARHANASKIDIAFSQCEYCYILEVRDNGIGIDFDTIKKGSFGLVGIRERIHLLDGTLSIDSKVGSGTAIKVRVPVRNS